MAFTNVSPPRYAVLSELNADEMLSLPVSNLLIIHDLTQTKLTQSLSVRKN